MVRLGRPISTIPPDQAGRGILQANIQPFKGL
jgi:hypothetical protein